ncbi:MAG: C-terminal binding protein [Chloroflexi bacterium]|nr:C-terminal binding protein [Chloroflexota bacterium]
MVARRASSPPVVAVVGTRYRDLEIEERALARFKPQWSVGWGGEQPELIELCRDAEVVLAGSRPRFTADVMQELRACKAIVRYGVGVDSVDLTAAKSLGIRVANVPDYCAEEVSDQALALALALLRKLKQADTMVREGRWELGPLRPMRAFREMTFGIFGLGRIGRTLARKARGIGFRTVGFDPAVSHAQAARWRIALLSEPDMLEQCDVLSLHMPLVGATRHFIGTERIARMKRGAVVVNTARGGLLDEAAVAEALRSGQLGGVGCDVLEQEPPGPGNPLVGLPNALVSPHTGWYSESSEVRMRELASAEAARALRGFPLRQPVV